MHAKTAGIVDRIARIAERMRDLGELADGMRTFYRGEQTAAACSVVSDIVAEVARDLSGLESDLEQLAHAKGEPAAEA